MLCEIYENEDGDNSCLHISNDERCIVEDTLTLHESLEKALWSPSGCPEGEEMRRKICECSCWSSIVDVYGPMLTQWSFYDDQVADKLSLLHDMCKRDVVSEFDVDFAESSTTQCAVNLVTVSMTVFAPMPAGSIITIIGLNGEPHGSMQLAPESSNVFGDLTWEPAVCTEWCSKVGMCPTTGSAEDETCRARPTHATGEVTDGRCVHWCDTDAQLTVAVATKVDANETLTIAVKMLNPGLEHTPNPLTVSASGSGLYLKPTIVQPVSGSQGVLSARTPPAFAESEPDAADDFQVSQDPCDDTSQLDQSTNKWRGSCAGMINTVMFRFRPNLELYAGSRIVISGLIRSGDASWPPPDFRDLPGMLKALSIEEWESSSGTLTLRVLEGEGDSRSPVVPAGEITTFALEFEMPYVKDEDAETPEVVVDVIRAGPRLNCDFIRYTIQVPSLLKASERTELSFPTRRVGSSTCFPGECNTFTITFTPNKLLSQLDAEVRIVILGLSGVDNSATCNPPASCGDPDPKSIPLQDAIEGIPCACLGLDASSRATFLDPVRCSDS